MMPIKERHKMTTELEGIRESAKENPDVLPVYLYRQDIDTLLALLEEASE